jgi:hypothetical protein
MSVRERRRRVKSQVYFPSSPSSFSKVVLCFSFLRFLRSGTTWVGGGVPIRSRASSLTAVTARNRLIFFLRAMQRSWSRSPAAVGLLRR